MSTLADDVIVRISTRGGAASKRDVDKVGDALRGLGRSAKEAEIASATSLGRFDARLRSLGDVQAGQGLKQLGGRLTSNVTLPLALAGGAAVKLGVDYETTFSRIQGLTGTTAGEIDGLKAAVDRLSGETARSPQELAEALYFIASAGITGADAVAVLESSARASAAGLGETATVAQLVTNAVNVYGADVLSAARATDVLTAAVRQGSAEPAEMAAQLGEVLPIAQALGIGFDQVGASVAVLTNRGLQTDKAVTALRSAMGNLLKPTAEARDALAGAGLSVEQLREQLAGEGVLSVLFTLQDAFEGNSDAMAQVFGDIQGLTGVLSLLAGDAAGTQRVFDGVRNSVGATSEAFNVFAGTDAFKLQQALVDNADAVREIGNALLPLAADVLPILATQAHIAADAFGALPGPLQGIAVGLGLLGGPALSLAGTLTHIQIAQRLAALAAAQQAAASGAAATAVGAQAVATNSASSVMNLYAASTGRAALATRALGFASGLIVTGGALYLITQQLQAGGRAAADAEEKVNSLISAAGGSLQGQLDALVTERRKLTGQRDDPFAGWDDNDTPRKVQARIRELNERIKELRGQIREIGTQSGQSFGEFEANVGTATGALDVWTSAVDRALSLGGGAGSPAAAATRDYDEAVASLGEALRDNETKERDRARAVEDARASIIDAKDQEAEAEKALREAIAGTTEVERRRLALTLERDRLSARQSVADRDQAQFDFDRARATGASPKVLAETELELEDARLRVEETNQRVADSEKAVADARPGSAAYARAVAEAERGLQQARRGVADATDRLREAQQRGAEPARTLAQRQREVGDAMDRVLAAARADVGAQIAAGLVPAQGATDALINRLNTIKALYPEIGSAIDQMVRKIAGAEVRVAIYDPFKPGGPVLGPLPRAKGSIDAHVTAGEAILYGERSTGGEAFVPKRGITPERAAEILNVAAGWHGMRVVPMALGGVVGRTRGAEPSAPFPASHLSAFIDRLGSVGLAASGLPRRNELDTFPARVNLVASLPGHLHVSGFETPAGVRWARSGLPFDREGDTFPPPERMALGGIAKAETVLWGERGTGAEAFIPRLGISRRRAEEILATAADWHGYRVVPMASGGVVGSVGRGRGGAPEVVVVPMTAVTEERYEFREGSIQAVADARSLYREARAEGRRRAASSMSRAK